MLALVGVGAGPAIGSAQQSSPEPALVFDRVTVIDVEQGKLLSEQRVVVVGNRIQAVGQSAAVQVPQGAQVVAAQGKYLIPGLWDMHVHPALVGDTTPTTTDIFHPLFLANGVTGIREAGSPVPLATLRRWRQEILAGTRVGPPRQIFSGQSIGKYGDSCDRGETRLDVQTCVGDSADAVHYVDSLKAVGADMIKPRDVAPETYFIIAAEARRIGIPFGGHTWDDIDLAASDSGARIIDHLFPFYKDSTRGLRGRCWAGPPYHPPTASVERCRPVVEQFQRNNTWVVPTLTVQSHVLQPLAGEFFGNGALLHGNWLHDLTPLLRVNHSPGDDTLGVLRVMQAVGFPIVTGTDVGAGTSTVLGYTEMPPGFALHVELAAEVVEGLTPLVALQTATLNPAKLWHATDSLGTVAPGKLADLVLLDANPLADITNTTTIRAVVANGRYFDRDALDRLLTGVQARNRAIARERIVVAQELEGPPPVGILRQVLRLSAEQGTAYEAKWNGYMTGTKVDRDSAQSVLRAIQHAREAGDPQHTAVFLGRLIRRLTTPLQQGDRTFEDQQLIALLDPTQKEAFRTWRKTQNEAADQEALHTWEETQLKVTGKKRGP